MRITVRLLILAVMAAVAVTAVPGAAPPAYAECGTAMPIDAALLQADAVFVGEVTSLTDRNREATMKVSEVWKGRDLPGTVVVTGGSGGATSFGPDDRTFQLGRTYLVVSDDTRSPFESDRCTATKLYTPAGGRAIPANLAAVLGVTQARAPLSSPGDEGDSAVGGTSILPYINIALVLVGLLAAGAIYKKLSNSRPRMLRRVEEPAFVEEKRGKSSADSLGKISRRVSVTGFLGRSGLQSARKLRGRRQFRRPKIGRRS